MDRSTLNKATSADDTPTPGYLCTEIAQATFVDVSACQTLADYLLKKLERDNPHVKAKVLRLVRFVCDNGKADFRRTMQRKADVVKACLQYRGQPDPLKGDALNKAVREAADAAVKSIFSADTATNAYGISANAGKKLQSFGSEEKDDISSHIGNLGGPKPGGSSFSNSSYSSNGGMGMGGPKSFSAGGMVGFGNDPSDVPGAQQSDTMFKQAMSSAFSAASRITSMVPGMAHADKSYAEPPGPGTSQGAYRAPPSAGTMGSGGGSGPWGPGGGGGGFGASAPAPKGPLVVKSSGEYEARVVAELCAPGGARVAPSQATLQEFVQKCESLDAAQVGDQLGQRLGAADWQSKTKALYAVEALAQNNLDGIVGHLSQHYSAQIFEAQKLPQCQQKASKVLVLLGLLQEEEAAAAPRASAAAAAPAPAPAAVDLLDFGDSGAAPAAPAATDAPPDLVGGSMDLLEAGPGPEPAVAAAPAPVPDVGGGLFGSLSMAGPPQEAPVPSGQPSLLATLEGQSAAPPPAAEAGGGGLFANLAVSSTPAYEPPGGMAAAPMPSDQVSAFPGLSGGQQLPQMGMPQQMAQPAVHPAAANPALGMSMGGGVQQAPNFAAMGVPGGMAAQGMSSGSNSSSAFGFISGSSPSTPAPMQGMAQVQGGMQPGLSGGMFAGLQQPGMQQGMQPGMQMGIQPGMQMGMQPGMQMGLQPGMQMGLQPGMQPGMSGMQPGFQSGMQLGMQGMQPSMGGMMSSLLPPPGAMMGGFPSSPASPPQKEQPASDNAFGFVSEQMKLHVEQSGSTASVP